MLRDVELDAGGRLDLYGMAESQLHLECVFALCLGAVTNADDFELLLEALANANDHVANQRSTETMHGLALATVIRTGQGNDALFERCGDLAGKRHRQLALRALDGHVTISDRDIDTVGDCYWSISNSRHLNSYQT